MKKLLSILIIAVLFVSCMVPAAFAAGDATVSANTVETKAGETVTLSVKISEATFSAYHIELLFDSSVLTLQSLDQGAASQGTFTPNVSNPGRGIANMHTTLDYTASGVLFTATFKVASDVAPGTYPVQVYVKTVANVTPAELSIDTVNGAVKVLCDHAWGDWTVTQAATCTEKGIETRECSICHETETREIPAAGHSWGDWTVTKAATCTEKGIETRECSVCGETETREIPMISHSFTDVWASDEDNHWHVCSVCGAIEGKEAHSFEWIVDKKATNSQTGLKHEECSLCHYKRNLNTVIPIDKDKDDVPQTGDITPMITVGAIAVLGVMMSAAIVIKRKFVK